jgi:hypothetical protein
MKKTLTVFGVLFLVLALSGSAVAAKGLLTGADIKDGSLTGADLKQHSLGDKAFDASARSSLRGLKGARGFAGDTGLTGPTGLTGLSGTSGGSGAIGLAGAAGTNGTAGAKGDTGTAGTNGTNGAAGAKGDTGTAGTNGTAGVKGDTGTNGTNGSNGTVTPLSATAVLSVDLPTHNPSPIVVAVVELTVPAGHYVVLAKTQLSHTGAGDSIDCWLKAGSTTLDQIAVKTLPALAAVPVSLQAVTTTVSPTVLSVQCAVQVANGAATFSSLIAIPAT